MKLSHISLGLFVAAMAYIPFAVAQDVPAPSSVEAVADMSKLPEPMGFVKGKYKEALALNKEAPSAARDAKVTTFVDDLADYDDLAKRSLGSRWDTLSVAKQAEFKATFREMVELMYVKKITDKSFNDNQQVDWDRVVKTKTGATVSCFTQQKDVETELEIVLHPGVVSWKIYDLLIDGASLADTYRKKYAKQLDEKGIDAILADMRKEIEELKKK